MRVISIPIAELLLLSLVCVAAILLGHTVHAIQAHEEQSVMDQFEARRQAIWGTGK